jgi:hypothetical protein
MTIRNIQLESDYPIIAKWWETHKAVNIPKEVFLPAAGYIAVDEQLTPVAVSWLFVASGTVGGIGMIEFTTTNPAFGISKKLLQAVNALYEHLEVEAWSRGCKAVMSMVEDGGSESRIMAKLGYVDVGGRPHLIYGKAIKCR